MLHAKSSINLWRNVPNLIHFWDFVKFPMHTSNFYWTLWNFLGLISIWVPLKIGKPFPISTAFMRVELDSTPLYPPTLHSKSFCLYYSTTTISWVCLLGFLKEDWYSFRPPSSELILTVLSDLWKWSPDFILSGSLILLRYFRFLSKQISFA